jgi:hypothetical protein
LINSIVPQVPFADCLLPTATATATATAAAAAAACLSLCPPGVNLYFTCPFRALNLFSFTFPGALPPGIPKQGFQPEEYNPDSARALSLDRLMLYPFLGKRTHF